MSRGLETLQQARITRDLLDGCLNRIFVTDDFDEFVQMVSASLTDFSLLVHFHYNRIKGI